MGRGRGTSDAEYQEPWFSRYSMYKADLCVLVAGGTSVTGGAKWLVFLRFGLGRGREARSSMEQRMHKRESERAQKKLFVAMDGWLRTKAVQNKRSRTGLAPLAARRPLFRSVCAIHVIFCLRNGERVLLQWREQQPCEMMA